MKPKILITGASGFIGSHLVEEAVRQGFDVYAGVRKSSSKAYLTNKSIHIQELDLSSREDLGRIFSEISKTGNGFQYVIHNAGITYARKGEEFQTVNFEYTKNLVEALQDSRTDLKKFVLISSLATQGPGNDKTMDPILLSNNPQPISSYAKSKLQAEQFLKTVVSLPYLIVKPTAVYGPRDKDFLQFIKLVKRGMEPYIGSHRQMISMLYVKDLSRAVIGLLGTSAVHRSYLISDRKSYDKQDLGATLKSMLSRRTFKVVVPLAALRWTILAVEKIYGLAGTIPFLNVEKLNEISQGNWLCDSSEVWQDLSSAPEYDLEKGMKETVSWYMENGWL